MYTKFIQHADKHTKRGSLCVKIGVNRLKTRLAVWRSGNTLVSIYRVTLRRAQLVLGWVTDPGFNSLCRKPQYITSHPCQTQPGHPSVGRRNEYQQKDGDVLQLGSKCRYGSCVGGR